MNRRQILTGAVSVAGASAVSLGLGTAASASLEAQEDAVVIYRCIRLPDRHVFSIDTGTMPPEQAQAYIREVMNHYRTNGARV